MGGKNSGNRSKLIDYEKQERFCTSCPGIKSFKEFGWDKRRNCPRSQCKACISLYAQKKGHEKSMQGRSDARN